MSFVARCEKLVAVILSELRNLGLVALSFATGFLDSAPLRSE